MKHLCEKLDLPQDYLLLYIIDNVEVTERFLRIQIMKAAKYLNKVRNYMARPNEQPADLYVFLTNDGSFRNINEKEKDHVIRKLSRRYNTPESDLRLFLVMNGLY